jgi:hypothetical protein
MSLSKEETNKLKRDFASEEKLDQNGRFVS